MRHPTPTTPNTTASTNLNFNPSPDSHNLEFHTTVCAQFSHVLLPKLQTDPNPTSPPRPTNTSLKTWPAVPFQVPIPNEPQSAHLLFTTSGPDGSRAQSAQMIDLLSREITYLIEHPLHQGPRYLVVVRKSTKVFVECSAGVWSFALTLDTLRALEGLVRQNGVREFRRFEVVQGGRVKAVCRLLLENPYGQAAAATSAAGEEGVE